MYYNSRTGERIHAEFPDGVVDDVNYGGSIKAFLFLLNNDCCTSIDKSRKFLSDLTGGRLNISKGMINKLSREFAAKTKPEQKMLHPVPEAEWQKNVGTYAVSDAAQSQQYPEYSNEIGILKKPFLSADIR